MDAPAVSPWPHDEPPGEEALDAALREEGLEPRWWSNGPDDRYDAHSHPYHKVLYCARGSISFQTGGGELVLGPGDRLDIPPGASHAALVGPEGVRCVEAARS